MSKQRTLAASAALLALSPAAAFAAAPSPKLERQYQKAFIEAKRAGAEPGRNILRKGVRIKPTYFTREARAAEMKRSLGVLRRMTGTPADASASTASGVLESIAACESGGDPTAISADGTYRGKYQFDHGTWASVGGSGDPAAAPEGEQDMRAQTLYEQRGAAPWPTCGS